MFILFFFQFSTILYRIPTIPINDGDWHHVGFAWFGITGQLILVIDGVLWASIIIKVKTIPSKGVLTIGKIVHNGLTYHFVGNISRVNMWSKAMSGSEIEELAKSPGSRDGDLISWFMVKDHISGQQVIYPSTAVFSGCYNV